MKKAYNSPKIIHSFALKFSIPPDRIPWLLDGWERKSTVILADYCGVPIGMAKQICNPPPGWGLALGILTELLHIT